MANDLNQVTMIGRLTRDPELRQIQSGTSVCSFGIANNKAYVNNGEKKEEVSFFNCAAWGRLGEIVNQYAQKGKQIAISGRLRQRSYENNKGAKISTVEIVVENMQLLGGRESSDSFSSPAPANSAPTDQQPTYNADDDIPF